MEVVNVRLVFLNMSVNGLIVIFVVLVLSKFGLV